MSISTDMQPLLAWLPIITTLAIGVGIMSIVMNAFKDKPTTLKPIDKENQRREYTTNNFER